MMSGKRAHAAGTEGVGLMRGCSVSGCGRKHHGRGYCNRHYRRWKERGTVVERPCWRGRPRSRPLEVRIAEKTPQGLPNDQCWQWMGSTSKQNGTARILLDGKAVGVVRLLLGFGVGDRVTVRRRPECRVPSCVNLAHYWVQRHVDGAV